MASRTCLDHESTKARKGESFHLVGRALFVPGLICCLLFGAVQLRAEKPAIGVEEVAATVGDDPIYVAEVNRLVKRIAQGREVNPAALPLLQAQALEEIVDRRLVLAYAKRKGWAATPAEIDGEIKKLKGRLSSLRQSLDEYLKGESIKENDLRRQIAWNLVWDRFLAKYITEARVEEYFQTHRRDFDGSEVSVSHILLRAGKDGVQGGSAELLKRAGELREEIVSGKISFADAARRYSAGPSAEDGGQLGFIPRHGVMDEGFSRAAFALEPGQVSEPVRTPFGVHLLCCNGIKPGKKRLDEVRKELDEALARELLDKLAQLQRAYTPVSYSGKVPYLRPGTREVVAQ
jgi:parvulin-like peptidyl-prolyl isomerase